MLRIGFIIDGLLIGKQYRDLVDWIAHQPDMQLSAFIVQDLPREGGRITRFVESVRRTGWYRTLSRITFGMVIRVERKLLRGNARYLDAVSIDHIDAQHLTVRPIISKGGFVYRYESEDLAAITALDLDVLVRAGSGILRGKILHSARYGILSLHHADNRINRGGPPGFWEVLHKEPYTGFVIQKLTEELDGGEILFRGSLPTQYSFLRNQISVYESTTDHFATVLRRHLGGPVTPEPPHIYSQRLFMAPAFASTIKYIAQQGVHFARRVQRRLLNVREHWQVAILVGNWREATLARGVVVPCPPGAFLADPFVIDVADSKYLFVEEYPYATRKGVISAYRIEGDGSVQRLGVALEAEFHLSYPYVFQAGNEIFMCPETAQTNQIRLYRSIDFPLRWELDTVLMDKVSAVDTNIFERDGRWWMLSSLKKSAIGGSSALYGFHADTPRGPWKPIRSNPLFVDASKGRNGGLLRDGEDIFRVAQSADFGEYGSRSSIYRIDHIDADGYRETLMQHVEPGFFPNIRGTHSLNNSGDVLVYDFWKYERVNARLRRESRQ